MGTMTLGKRIATARRSAGFTQLQLAQICGWDPPSRLANYEQDAREPTLADLRAIAEAVKLGGHTYAWILMGDEGVPAESEAQSQSQSARPDFERIGASVMVLLGYLQEKRQPVEWVHDPQLLEIADAIVQEYDQPVTPSNVSDLTERLGQRLRAEGKDGKQGGKAQGSRKAPRKARAAAGGR